MKNAPKWARALVIGCDAPEPIMTYRLLDALAPYTDFQETQEEVERLRDSLRWRR